MEHIPRDPRATLEHWGYIPLWLSDDDPRPAKEQLNSGYVSGWRPFKGFTMNAQEALVYPGDPPQRPIAEIKLREERIILYPSAWVAIIQPDGSFEVCRMD